VGVEPDHDLVDPVQAPLTLPDDLRFMGSVAVPRHVQLDRAGLGQHRLGSIPVAAVPTALTDRVADLVTEVIGQLLGQRVPAPPWSSA